MWLPCGVQSTWPLGWEAPQPHKWRCCHCHSCTLLHTEAAEGALSFQFYVYVHKFLMSFCWEPFLFLSLTNVASYVQFTWSSFRILEWGMNVVSVPFHQCRLCHWALHTRLRCTVFPISCPSYLTRKCGCLLYNLLDLLDWNVKSFKLWLTAHRQLWRSNLYSKLMHFERFMN